jgi:hypothetical protein
MVVVAVPVLDAWFFPPPPHPAITTTATTDKKTNRSVIARKISQTSPDVKRVDARASYAATTGPRLRPRMKTLKKRVMEFLGGSLSCSEFSA